MPHVSYIAASRAARGYGVNCTTVEDAIQAALQRVDFSLVDRGTLLRIADALELCACHLDSLQRHLDPMRRAQRKHLVEQRAQRLAARMLGVPADSAQPVPDVPIADLKWSTRVQKCFIRLGISTLSELVRKTEDDLWECKNFGITSMCEIRDKLATLGLHLRYSARELVARALQERAANDNSKEIR